MSDPARRRRSGARALGGKTPVDVPANESASDDVGGETAGELSAEAVADSRPSRRDLRRERAAAKGDRPLGQSSPWVPALMVAFFVLGLLWLVVYYLAGTQVPVMSDFGNWNLLIGIGAIAVGFVVSTRWR